jgi:hypothetical protein
MTLLLIYHLLAGKTFGHHPSSSDTPFFGIVPVIKDFMFFPFEFLFLSIISELLHANLLMSMSV